MSEAAKIISDIYVGNRQMRFAERQKIENEITTLRQLLERAEARVAEYQESITAFVAENERLQAELDQVEAVSPSAILRKQAEAVEAIKDFKIVAYGSTGVAVDVYEILKYAQRFRNQADELEKTGGSDA